MAKIANSKNLTTLPEFFDNKTVNKIKKVVKQMLLQHLMYLYNDRLREILNNIENF